MNFIRSFDIFLQYIYLIIFFLTNQLTIYLILISIFIYHKFSVINQINKHYYLKTNCANLFYINKIYNKNENTNRVCNCAELYKNTFEKKRKMLKLMHSIELFSQRNTYKVLLFINQTSAIEKGTKKSYLQCKTTKMIIKNVFM
jgi:hypothetical protein